MKRPKWIVLDRDGTIITEKNYLSNPCDVELIENAALGLRRLAQAGYRFFVATNQSGVGRGYFSKADMVAVNKKTEQLLFSESVIIDGFFCCVHSPEEGCDCRKPKLGLIINALKELNIDKDDIFCVVGDKKSDIDMALNLGVDSVLVSTGYGRKEYENGVRGTYYALDMLEAADILITKTEAYR